MGENGFLKNLKKFLNGLKLFFFFNWINLKKLFIIHQLQGDYTELLEQDSKQSFLTGNQEQKEKETRTHGWILPDLWIFLK